MYTNVKRGHVVELRVPTSPGAGYPAQVSERWERIQPRALAAMLKASLSGRSSSCALETTDFYAAM